MKTQTKFKKSEIGMMPEDWKVGVLKNICANQNGIQTGPFGSQLHQKDYKSTGTPIITVEHLGENRIIRENIPYVSDDDKKRLTRYTLKVGDIVFSRVGSVDRRVLVREAEDGWLFSGRCLRVRPNQNLVDPEYLSWFFGLPAFKEHIRKIAVGATMPSLNTEILSNVEVVLPALPEQRSIASILGALDSKIALNRAMNSTLEAIGQALFKHWFVDFEFPNEEGKPYKLSGGEMVDSELGEVPKGWGVKPIDEIAEFLNGLALQKYPPKDENFLPVIKIRELRQGTTESSDKASPDIDEKYIVEDGDILFSWSGSLEVCIWCGGRGALNQHLFKVTSQNYPKWFYYQWTKVYLPEFQRIAEGKATTMGHIQRRHLSGSFVAVPPSEILGKADNILSPLIKRYISNAIESHNLSQVRDILLPKLMSGEIRTKFTKGVTL